MCGKSRRLLSEIFSLTIIFYTVSQKTTLPKQTSYQWFSAEKIVIHSPTNCEWKVWYRSRTICTVSTETVAPLQDRAPAEWHEHHTFDS